MFLYVIMLLLRKIQNVLVIFGVSSQVESGWACLRRCHGAGFGVIKITVVRTLILPWSHEESFVFLTLLMRKSYIHPFLHLHHPFTSLDICNVSLFPRSSLNITCYGVNRAPLPDLYVEVLTPRALERGFIQKQSLCKCNQLGWVVLDRVDPNTNGADVLTKRENLDTDMHTGFKHLSVTGRK